MSQLATSKSYKNEDQTSACSEQRTLADRELAAFFTAVKRLFGSEQAELAAQDWLQELQAISILPASVGEWRRITVRVAQRLAQRVSVPLMPAVA